MPAPFPEYFHADFFSFDTERVAWTDITNLLSGPRIPGRSGHGFAAAGGMIYVYGGSGEVGEAPDSHHRDTVITASVATQFRFQCVSYKFSCPFELLDSVLPNLPCLGGGALLTRGRSRADAGRHRRWPTG